MLGQITFQPNGRKEYLIDATAVLMYGLAIDDDVALGIIRGVAEEHGWRVFIPPVCNLGRTDGGNNIIAIFSPKK